MKPAILPLCLFLGAALAVSGCAKPPVRNYPRPGASIPAPQPKVSTRTQPQAPKPVPRAEAPPPAVQTPPPAPYEKPLAPVGTRPGSGASGKEGYLLAATTPLADQARRQLAGGDLDGAQTTAERAVRIDPNDADLWHLMGEIQLARKNYSQAEQLARKSNLLAKGDRPLQARNWRLIAECLQAGNDAAGAANALGRARELESR